MTNELLKKNAEALKQGTIATAEASEKVKKYLDGMQVVKFIFVPKRMISFVVKPAK